MFESPVPMQILASMVFIQNCFSLDKEHFRAETCRARNKVLFNFNLCVCRDFTKYLSRETFGKRIFREISFNWWNFVKKKFRRNQYRFYKKHFAIFSAQISYRYCPSSLCNKKINAKIREMNFENLRNFVIKVCLRWDCNHYTYFCFCYFNMDRGVY